MQDDQRPVLVEDRRRVLMDDTDAAGVVYFGCVFRWHEALVGSWLMANGHPMRSLLDARIAFPCVHSEADYKHPLTVDDELDVHLKAGRVGRTSFELVSEAWLGKTHALTVRAVYVWAELSGSGSGTFRPVALPDWLRSALTSERVGR